MNLLQRYGRDFRNALRREKYVHVDDGVEFFGGIVARGMFREGIAGQPESWRYHKNLVPDAAILHYLGVVLCGTTQITTWYLAPYGGNVSPAASWTAANFTANSTEITSTSQGFSEATRQAFVPGTPAAGSVGNDAAKATFSIVCTSTINIYGAGLLSSSTRGGTSGVLLSAVKFGTVRVANDGDPWQCQYDVTLTSS
jgi:hypothetical protein